MVLVISLSGCISSYKQKTINPAVDAAQVLIQGAVVDPVEAFSTSDRLFVRYHVYFNDSSFSRELSGKVSWKDDGSSGDLSKSIAAPIENIPYADYKAQTAGLTKVKILPFSFWQDFRQKLIHQLTPEEKNKAVSLRQGEQEVITFYDDNGQIQMMDVAQKPGNVSIVQALTQEELSERIIQLFKDHLKAESIDGLRFLMPTFHENGLSGIFLFIDLEGRMMLTVKADEISERYKGNVVGNGIKSMDYMILDSHVIGVIKRPVSSAFRLFHWTKDTAYDVVNPDKLQILERTPPPALSQGPAMDLDKFEERLDKVTGTRRTAGTMEFFIGGDEFFPHLIESLLDAKESILFRIFIFDNDDYAVKIADILKEKSKTVNVQVLLDSMGPAIYAAGVAAISDLVASPPVEGSTNSVTLPIPLVGGADAYVVLLTTLNGGKAYVTSMDDDGDGNFVSFDVSVETECDVMYMVVKKGFRPSIK